MTTKKTIIAGAVFIVVVVSLAIFYVHELNRAHSTFENYAAFRGCTATSNKTDTSADCLLASGKSIKLVLINDKWYLEGDGPGVW